MTILTMMKNSALFIAGAILGPLAFLLVVALVVTNVVVKHLRTAVTWALDMGKELLLRTMDWMNAW